MKRYTVILLSIASAICTALCCVWLIAPVRQPPIYRVDVLRIVMAQAALLHDSSDGRRHRLASPKRVREAINTVAGTHLVLASQAVIQGTTDITPMVLIELGLPPELPKVPPVPQMPRTLQTPQMPFSAARVTPTGVLP